MHYAIEFAKRKTEIFVPQQWATVRMARRKDPYLIVPLIYGDIYDFKDLAKTSMTSIPTPIKLPIIAICFIQT
jgi:hypothetical protein